MAQQFVSPDLLTAGPTGNIYLAAIQDANNHLAIAQTPYYQTASGMLIPAPADANGIPYQKSAGSNSLANGTQTLTTSLVQLPDQTAVEVLLQSALANTDTILVGDSTSQVMELAPGATMTLSVTNLNLIYAAAATSSATLNWMVRAS